MKYKKSNISQLTLSDKTDENVVLPLKKKPRLIDEKKIIRLAKEVKKSFEEQAKYMAEKYGDYTLSRLFEEFRE